MRKRENGKKETEIVMNEKKKTCWTTKSMRKRRYGKRQKIVNNREKNSWTTQSVRKREYDKTHQKL